MKLLTTGPSLLATLGVLEESGVPLKEEAPLLDAEEEDIKPLLDAGAGLLTAQLTMFRGVSLSEFVESSLSDFASQLLSSELVHSIVITFCTSSFVLSLNVVFS